MNKITVKYKNNNEINNCINYDENQCIICSDEENLVILENNFCKCFKHVVFCEECFLNWLFNNCKCLICRNKFQDENLNKFSIFNIIDNNIHYNILLKLEARFINIPNDNRVITRNNIINNSDYSNYTVDFRNRYLYYSYKTYIMVLLIYSFFICIYNSMLLAENS